ncbi:MAG: hypothetical protein CMO81_03155 [Waddliaceae bacterium]|nr:hypothetical protein [Waddliaceae bacterium]
MIRFFLCLLTLVSLSSCSNSEKEGKVRLLLEWLPNPDHVPLYVGIEKGIFAKHGIDLSIYKAHDPGDGVPLLVGENVDLHLCYAGRTMNAKARGADLKVIGYLFKQSLNSILYRGDLGIESPQDLEGRRMGYTMGNDAGIFIDTIKRAQNIHHLNILNVDFDIVSMLGNKEVDAVLGAYWNVELPQLQWLGIPVGVFTFADLGIPSYCELIVLAKNGTPYADKEFVKNFRLALDESIQYSKENQEEAFAIYLNQNPDKSGKSQEWERKSWKTTCPLFAENQEDDLEQWETFYEWRDSNGLVSSPFDVKDLFVDFQS